MKISIEYHAATTCMPKKNKYGQKELNALKINKREMNAKES